MSIADGTMAPRPGEKLDHARLREYLRRECPEFRGEMEVSQFPSGHSNLSYLIRIGTDELVLRRPPGGKKPKSGHDMHREWTVLSALKNHFSYAPEPIAYCEDPEVLGAPFLLMRRIRGLILHRDLPAGMTLPAKTMRSLCEQLVDTQSELHSLDYQALGLGEFGHPEGYVQRQISGWSRRYRKARTPDVPDFEEIIEWLEQHQAPEQGAAIIHNDYRFDNVVLEEKRPHRILAILDWEMATIGDPLMDLGASLAYWVEAGDPQDLQSIRLVPTHLPGALTRRELMARYLSSSGLDADNLSFYFVYGIFRLAGIAQQIYYRFYHHQSRDPRFGRLGHAVKVLETAALRAIETGEV